MVEGNDARPGKEAPGKIITTHWFQDDWKQIGKVADMVLARIAPEPPDKAA